MGYVNNPPHTFYMHTHSNHIEAGTLSKAALGWLCLALHFVMLNTSTVYYQISGFFPAHAAAGLFFFFVGLLCAALTLPLLERAIEGGGRKGIIAQVIFLSALLAPAASFLVISPLGLEEYGSIEGVAYIQIFLSGLLPAVAFRSFFRNVPVADHAFSLGLAMGVAYGYWALFMPLLGDVRELSALAEKRWVSLLFAIRCVTGVAFAFVAWRLHPRPQNDGELPGQASQAVEPIPKKSLPPALSLLFFPLAASCFLSGLLDYQLSFRLLAYGGSPEYIPLALTLLLPLTAAVVTQKGDAVLQGLLIAGAFLCALSPLLLAPKESPFHMGVYTMEVIGYQTLLFASVLICARFAERSNRPALTLCLPWIVTSVFLLAGHFSRSLLASFSLSPGPLVWCLGGLSVLSALALWRVFPLPAPLEASAPPRVIPGDGFSSLPSTADRIQDFAEQRQLSRREKEILELLLQGHSTEEMAAALQLKESSVRRYVNSLLQKTEAGSRLGLVAMLTSREKADKKHPAAASPSQKDFKSD